VHKPLPRELEAQLPHESWRCGGVVRAHETLPAYFMSSPIRCVCLQGVAAKEMVSSLKNFSADMIIGQKYSTIVHKEFQTNFV
jgi:hypothetical protein